MVACSDSDESAKETNEETKTQEEEPAGDSEAASEDGESAQPEMPEPDLEGIPDVVAEVNGEEIPKEEFEASYTGQFQKAAMQSQMSGQEVDQEKLKQQIADSMIGLELLKQEANSSDFKASEEEVNETLDGLVEQYGLKSQDEFLTTLEDQGMAKEEIMSQLETQVKIDKLIANESGDIEITDDELQELYEQYKAQQEQMGGKDGEEVKIQSFEEMKPTLETQIKSQKEGQVYQKLVERLREDADVTNHL